MKICVLVLVFFFLISCKESKRENISNLVTEWMGREIVYPNDMVFTLWGKDTVNMDRTPYTIVTYADSVGCISCKLQLSNWQAFIVELKDKVPEKVNIHFVFHLKDSKDTSCGCTTVSYSQEPVQPGKEIKLDITYKADHPEHFSKTITVYCNTESSPIRLTISGDAK